MVKCIVSAAVPLSLQTIKSLREDLVLEMFQYLLGLHPLGESSGLLLGTSTRGMKGQ